MMGNAAAPIRINISMNRRIHKAWLGGLGAGLGAAVLLGAAAAVAADPADGADTNAPGVVSPSALTETSPATGDDRDSTSTVDATNRDREGRILTTEDVEKSIDPNSSFDGRPTPPDYQALSPQMRQKLIEFQRLRVLYLKDQERLTRQFKSATEEDRRRIREMIRAKRDRWTDQSRRLREQHRDRLLEIRRELRNYKDVLDSAQDRIERDGQD
jgi:hypothetical protein